MAREAIDDFSRHRQDTNENNTKTTKLKNGNWTTSKWKHLHVGDLVYIVENEFIPADICVLSTSKKDGIAYIESSNLDGETSLKIKSSLVQTHSFIQSQTKGIQSLRADIHTEAPSGDLYNWKAFLLMPSISD